MGKSGPLFKFFVKHYAPAARKFKIIIAICNFKAML